MHISQAIVEHLEQQDVEAFTETVKEYDSICRLDSWYAWPSELSSFNIQLHFHTSLKL